MARTHVAVAAMLVSLSSASASSQTLVGYGAATCAAWIEAHRSANAPDKVALDGWAFGYLDGLAKYIESEKQLKNLPAADILKGLDRPAVVELTNQFCLANPAQTLDNALAAMTAQLAVDDARISRVSGTISSSVGNTPTANNTPGVNNVPGGLNPDGPPAKPGLVTNGLNARPQVLPPTAPGTSGVAR